MVKPCEFGTAVVAVGYDSDLDPPPKTQQKFLWRSDPKESLSDYQIQVVERDDVPIECILEDDDEESPTKKAKMTTTSCNGNKKDHSSAAVTKTFYVHKCVLAGSARRSEYYRDKFLKPPTIPEEEEQEEAEENDDGEAEENDGVASPQKRKATPLLEEGCRFGLHPLALAALPYLLDYIYLPNQELEIDSDTATALHSLAHFFKIRELRWDAKQFWKADLNFQNAYHYYQHARIFQDEKLLQAIAQICGKHLLEFDSDAGVEKYPILFGDFSMWRRILDFTNCAELSQHASRLIACVCFTHRESLTRHEFEALTDKAYLPHLDYSQVHVFLDLESQFTTTTTDLTMTMTSLQQRAVNALEEHWPEIVALPASNPLKDYLRQHKPHLLVEVALRLMDGGGGGGGGGVAAKPAATTTTTTNDEPSSSAAAAAAADASKENESSSSSPKNDTEKEQQQQQQENDSANKNNNNKGGANKDDPVVLL